MSKFARMIDVLDLFSEDRTMLTAEEIADRLGVSRPTGFRYARELSAAGFLANYAGRYSLGARIITLDYRIREADPLLAVAREPMRQLAEATGCRAVLCRMYNDDVVSVHHQGGEAIGGVVLARGHPLPLWRGAASKVMLAHLPVARLRRLYERHHQAPELQALAPDWTAFKAHFARIRRQGYYDSHGELSEGITGVAVPIVLPKVGVVAVTSLVFRAERRDPEHVLALARRLQVYSDGVAQALADAAPPKIGE